MGVTAPVSSFPARQCLRAFGRAGKKKLTARLDGHEVAIIEVLRLVMDILDPPPPLPESSKRQIGFTSSGSQT